MSMSCIVMTPHSGENELIDSLPTVYSLFDFYTQHETIAINRFITPRRREPHDNEVITELQCRLNNKTGIIVLHSPKEAELLGVKIKAVLMLRRSVFNEILKDLDVHYVLDAKEKFFEIVDHHGTIESFNDEAELVKRATDICNETD